MAKERGVQTSRLLAFGPGRASRVFTLQGRSGVVLVNRLTVPHGVSVIAEATIRGVAHVRVSTTTSAKDPSLTCHRGHSFDVCTQEEEWCPMPRAQWHVKLVKLKRSCGPCAI